MKWGRLLTAMVTPFDRNLNVDYGAAASLVDLLLETGTDAIVVGGTTGESPTLDLAEKTRLFETVVRRSAKRAAVIAGTGTNSTSDTVKLSRIAEDCGADGIMLVTPYYNKPPQAGLVRHFAEVATAVPLPMLVYNVPSRTGVNMLPHTLQMLAQVANIVAVKEAAGSIDQFSEIVSVVPSDFLVYSGDDSMTLPALSVGAHGVVSVAAHVAGQQIKRMIEAYVLGKTDEAAKTHRDLFALFKAVFVTTNPIPIKAALRMKGFDAGGVRSPLSIISEKEENTLRSAMAATGIIER